MEILLGSTTAEEELGTNKVEFLLKMLAIIFVSIFYCTFYRNSTKTSVFTEIIFFFKKRNP